MASGPLTIVNVNDPEHPNLLSRYIPVGIVMAFDLSVVGRYAYIASIPSLIIIDVSDPLNPQLAGYTSLNSFVVEPINR